MASAFQSDAFQNNAFQIEEEVVTAVDEGRIFKFERRQIYSQGLPIMRTLRY